ncbi:MAG TPA: class E sortase [Candidatus Dormibacteraeota bacterium]|jgi:LPXTG-site transpeptidase (sortase) family protein|nr:class E sortase [Candidatus Dormibacteraeota bacterium]
MVRWVVRAVGVALIVVGGFTVWQFVQEVRGQGQATQAQTQGWHDLVAAAAGPEAVPSPAASGAPAVCPDCYLELTVPKLNRSMVAIDSDWTGLKRAPMVHYRTSPAPGQVGNVLVAFHREFSWRDIDQLGPGDTVVLQTKDGHTFIYVVEFRRIVSPNDVSLLQPSTSRNLTLITCDPWLQDYNRMLFRLHLVEPSPPPTPPSGGA